MHFAGCSLMGGENPSKNGVPACFGAKTPGLGAQSLASDVPRTLLNEH